MTPQELDQQLAAAKPPVQASDLGDSAATPKADALLQHILAQPPVRRRGALRNGVHRGVRGPAWHRRGPAWHRRLIAAALTLLMLGGMQLWPLPASQALASWTPTPRASRSRSWTT